MDKSLVQMLHETLITQTPVVTMPQEALFQALDREASRQFVLARRFLFSGFILLVYIPGLDNMIQNPPATLTQWIPRLLPLFLFTGVLCWNGLPRKAAAMPMARRFREALLFRALARISWAVAGVFAVIFLLRRLGCWEGLNLSNLPDMPLGITLAFTIPGLAWVLYVGSRELARRLDPYWFE